MAVAETIEEPLKETTGETSFKGVFGDLVIAEATTIVTMTMAEFLAASMATILAKDLN